MTSVARYDTIGHRYTDRRRPDPRIEAQIWAAIGEATRIVNVGAGTGSYETDPGPAPEPARATDGRVVAVEPSAVMIDQRAPGAAPVVRATAEHLPFGTATFDVALAVLTVHHWAGLRAGLREMRRVAGRQVVMTIDAEVHDRLWLIHEYVPAIRGMSDGAPLDEVVDLLQAHTVEVVPIPADCTDGFLLAYWSRPEQYLEQAARANTSAFARLSPAEVEPGLTRLARDLADGTWARHHADLLHLSEFDAGLRLVIAGESAR